jgi:hypothetical protein
LNSRDLADIQTRFASVEQEIGPVLNKSGGSNSAVAGESFR